jgi:hypothetical protein
MKKTTLLLFSLVALTGFAQSKSTGVLALNNGIAVTANFTLNNDTSLVTLVLTGPSDRWFGLGIGVVAGFGMSAGDVVVYTNVLSDRNYVGFQAPAVDAEQSWTMVSNTTAGTVRTLTLTRGLTNSDANDFQLPYATTNTISIGGARAGTATINLGSHGGGGFASGTFTTLGVEDFSLNATVIYPNPSRGIFTVKAKSALKTITIYAHTGALVKSIQTIESENTEVNVEGLPTGIYLVELQNDTDKSWKKVIIE